MKNNKFTSTIITLEERNTPRIPGPTLVIWVNATVRSELRHIEDGGRDKQKTRKIEALKNSTQSLDQLSKRNGYTEKINSTIRYYPTYIYLILYLVNCSPVEDLNIAYALLGGKLSLIPDKNILTVETVIERDLGNKFQIN